MIGRTLSHYRILDELGSIVTLRQFWEAESKAKSQ